VALLAPANSPVAGDSLEQIHDIDSGERLR